MPKPILNQMALEELLWESRTGRKNKGKGPQVWVMCKDIKGCHHGNVAHMPARCALCYKRDECLDSIANLANGNGKKNSS